MGSEGWILDLSLLKEIDLDAQQQTVTIQSGVLTKDLNIAVGNAGFCIQSPSGGQVGFVPFLLGGGSTYLAGMYGMAVDSLISAKIVTASRGLVVASEEENQDLFWALKGAGQFFGVVVEVKMRIFPLKEKITSWTCIFPPNVVKELASTLEKVVNEAHISSPGMCAIMESPGQSKVCY
jgi:FAD/FMN-containing dehydrogenase